MGFATIKEGDGGEMRKHKERAWEMEMERKRARARRKGATKTRGKWEIKTWWEREGTAWREGRGREDKTEGRAPRETNETRHGNIQMLRSSRAMLKMKTGTGPETLE